MTTTPYLTDPFLTVKREDWFDVRSPNRARRRLKQGHRQAIRYYYAPDPAVYEIDGVKVCHPVTLAKLMKRGGI